MWLVGHKSWITFSTVIGWHKCWWALIGWAGLVSVSHLWTWPSETCEDRRSFTTVTHSPLLCWRNALKSLPGFHQLYYQETFYTQELVFPLYSKYSNQDLLFLLFHQTKLLNEGRLESSVFSQLCERWTLLNSYAGSYTHMCLFIIWWFMIVFIFSDNFCFFYTKEEYQMMIGACKAKFKFSTVKWLTCNQSRSDQ